MFSVGKYLPTYRMGVLTIKVISMYMYVNKMSKYQPSSQCIHIFDPMTV